MPKTKKQYVIGTENGRFVLTVDQKDAVVDTNTFMTKEGRVSMLRDWHLPDAKQIRRFSSRLRAETFYKKNREFFEKRDFVIMPYNQALLNSILYLKIAGL